MIFDSSVWIDYLKGVRTSATQLLDEKFDIYGKIDIEICPPIFQEVLQGIKTDKKFNEIKDLLLTTNFIKLDPYFVAEGGADIYRMLRKYGVTINKPNDCLIAFYSIHFKLPLVHNDDDFDKIAKHTSLNIYST